MSTAAPETIPGPAAVRSARIAAIDWMRGFVMILREAWGTTTALVESVMTDKVENNV